MTLNYWMMVERYPNLKEEVGRSIPGCVISSLLDRNLALAYRPSVSNQKKAFELGGKSAAFAGCSRMQFFQTIFRRKVGTTWVAGDMKLNPAINLLSKVSHPNHVCRAAGVIKLR